MNHYICIDQKTKQWLASRRTEILAWYDYYISTGKVEGDKQ